MTQNRTCSSLLLRQSGFSLIEVLIATGISGFMIVIVATMITQLSYRKISTEERMRSESGILRAEWLIRSYLGQAVNIYGNGAGSLDTYAGPQGRLRLFNGNSTAITPVVTTVGAFIREAGSRSAGGSILRPTAIFFHRPSATKSGVVFIDAGTNPASLKADYGDFYFDNVVEFETRDFTYYNGNPSLPLLSAEVRIVIRYFTTENSTKSWCPQAELAAGSCTRPTAYRDDQRVFRVFFRNNDLNVTARGGGLREFVHGFLYFFGSKTKH